MVQGHCGAPAQAWSGGEGPLSESGQAPRGLQLEREMERLPVSLTPPLPQPWGGLWKGPSLSPIRTG